MSIFLIGFNYKTAPIGLREQVYFPVDRLPLYLQDILTINGVHEAVLLSTCHRSELYCSAENVEDLRTWFLKQAGAWQADAEQALYLYQDQEAIAHIMRVAAGLDSMVIGEPQIFGQIKEAYSESSANGAIGTVFHRLFQQVFAVCKMIRTTTTIGACPVSLASSAVHFAKTQVPHFATSQVALVGAGDTAQLMMRYLVDTVSTPIQLVNRSTERAAALALEYPLVLHDLACLDQVLQASDVVFTATGSANPLIEVDLLSRVMQARHHRPLLLIDIAVPRNVDPACAAVPGVALHCVDDLKQTIEANRKGREHARDKAEECIQQSSQALFVTLQSLDKVAHTIRTYRSQIEALCYTELSKAKAALKEGVLPEAVLEQFAHAFVNKIMHAPSATLRQAGQEGRFELLRFAKQLFALPDPEVELS
jgi:glutamyl-tRNA reductase